MKLHSLKRAPKEKEEAKDCVSPCGDYEQPDYPYGTRMSLDDEGLAAMGITSISEVGAPVSINAIGTVVLMSEESVEGGKPNRRLEIQITDMALAFPGEKLSARMYPDKKKA